MATPTAGPVADFCAELHLLVRKCRVQQKEIAEALGLSAASVSELLNGRRRTPPDWDTVRRIVELCGEQNGTAPPPPGMSLDSRWWRLRYAELERAVENMPGRLEQTPAPDPVPVPRLNAVDSVGMGVEDAVELLTAGRMKWAVLMDALMAPPSGEESRRRVLDHLLEGFPGRVRAAHGVARAVLIQAARVVLVAAAVVRRSSSRDEVAHLAYDLANGAHTSYVSPLLNYRETLEKTRDSRIADDYRRLAEPLAACCPEFALVAGLPAASGNGRSATGLAGLQALLSDFVDHTGQGGTRAPHSAALLRSPIASLDSPGPRLPSLAEGYVTPRFRLAGGSDGEHAAFASDKWWDEEPLRDDIERFLAAHLLGLPALLAPLVVLGHPGAGKSLLTKLLTARLPATEFRPLRVELRHMPAEADVQTQLEHTLRRDTGRAVNWPDWSEEESGPIPVVLLDGFDELLQAGAQRLAQGRQWRYLREVEEFQRREARNGRPLIVIVTSRTVVADRAEIPATSPVLRLEPFGESEIERWLTVWNTTNAGFFDRHALLPLTPEVVLPHRDLAAQPLLLLMLALYDSIANALHPLRDEEISRAELYDRLLTEFVRRQVDKDGPRPPAEASRAVERELHRLSVVALSMFHRGAQSISAEDAHRDLRALGEADDGSGLLFGRFFFVHEAQAVVTEERLRSYEFMHATFGEHLAARLIEGALRRLVDSPAPSDDAELYALLSFTPLTDRAQLVQNLRDMLETWPPHLARTTLRPSLVALFRAAAWDPDQRSPVEYAPVRLRRAYRDSVYEANLVLVAVLAAGEVYASDLVGDVRDTAANWRRHAQGWQAQLSTESWYALSSALDPERCHRPDPRHPAEEVADLRLTTRRRPLADHDANWPGSPAEATRSLSDGVAGRLSGSEAMRMIERVLFVGEPDSERLLHACYPLMLQWPTTMYVSIGAVDSRLTSAVQPLVALLTRDVYAPGTLPSLYTECFVHTASLTEHERGPYLEAVLRQLAHDAPALSEEALASVLSGLHGVLTDDSLILTPEMQQPLLDCVYDALHRGSPRLTTALEALRAYTAWSGVPLRTLVTRADLARSTHIWRWWGSPPASEVRHVLQDLDLPAVATTRPTALVDILRLAAELGLDDWLATHTAEILAVLPPEAFGLLRPSDLPRLRAALPEGAYAEQFDEVENVWRAQE